MKMALITTVTALLLTAGCETSSDRPRPDRQGYYEPTDGRNLDPAMQDASHGDPQFPNDVDRGGGGPR